VDEELATMTSKDVSRDIVAAASECEGTEVVKMLVVLSDVELISNARSLVVEEIDDSALESNEDTVVEDTWRIIELTEFDNAERLKSSREMVVNSEPLISKLDILLDSVLEAVDSATLTTDAIGAAENSCTELDFAISLLSPGSPVDVRLGRPLVSDGVAELWVSEEEVVADNFRVLHAAEMPSKLLDVSKDSKVVKALLLNTGSIVATPSEVVLAVVPKPPNDVAEVGDSDDGFCNCIPLPETRTVLVYEVSAFAIDTVSQIDDGEDETYDDGREPSSVVDVEFEVSRNTDVAEMNVDRLSVRSIDAPCENVSLISRGTVASDGVALDALESKDGSAKPGEFKTVSTAIDNVSGDDTLV
jgi:hypothetical protein